MSRLDEAFTPHEIEDAVGHVRDSVHINGADLKHELERVPSDLAHYGFEFARSHRKWIAAKMHVEEVKAMVYLHHRETLLDLGEKVTEAVIDAHVTRDDRYSSARASLIESEYEREQLRAVVDGLRAKRESLTSLVSLARAELAGSGHGYRDSGQPEGAS